MVCVRASLIDPSAVGLAKGRRRLFGWSCLSLERQRARVRNVRELVQDVLPAFAPDTALDRGPIVESAPAHRTVTSGTDVAAVEHLLGDLLDLAHWPPRARRGRSRSDNRSGCAATHR